MRISFDRGLLGSLYLMATGAGYAAYDTYPSPWAFLFLAALSIYVVAVAWVGWRIHAGARGLRNTDAEAEFRSLVDTLHLPCGRPSECERCAGFHWGLSTTMIAGVSASVGLLSADTISRLFGRSSLLLGVIAFVLVTGVHGVLNSLQSQGRIETDSILFEGRSKLLLGFVAGLAVVVMGLSAYIIAI